VSDLAVDNFNRTNCNNAEVRRCDRERNPASATYHSPRDAFWCQRCIICVHTWILLPVMMAPRVRAYVCVCVCAALSTLRQLQGEETVQCLLPILLQWIWTLQFFSSYRPPLWSSGQFLAANPEVLGSIHGATRFF
jgi:hypothetical protein